jgi:hypothetical protein
MYLCISGFLPDDAEDDLIKFELDLDSSFNDQVLQLLGHRSLEMMAEGEWLLTHEQATQLSEIIGQPLPTELTLFIGVEA